MLLGLGWFGGRLRALRHATATSGAYRRWMMRLFFPMIVGLWLLSLWSRHRWLESFRSTEWPLGFLILTLYCSAFAIACRPGFSPAGILRIEGEANTVLG